MSYNLAYEISFNYLFLCYQYLKRFFHILGVNNSNVLELLNKSLVNFQIFASIFSKWFFFRYVADFLAADSPTRKKKRFEVSLYLTSVAVNIFMRFKLFISENENILSLAQWNDILTCLEREAWDMYGIFFKFNSDQRRILSDYGFKGYPLRKDFPTTGYSEIRFDEELSRIIYEPLALTQMLRMFDFLSPWREFNRYYYK